MTSSSTNRPPPHPRNRDRREFPPQLRQHGRTVLAVIVDVLNTFTAQVLAGIEAADVDPAERVAAVFAWPPETARGPVGMDHAPLVDPIGKVGLRGRAWRWRVLEVLFDEPDVRGTRSSAAGSPKERSGYDPLQLMVAGRCRRGRGLGGAGHGLGAGAAAGQAVIGGGQRDVEVGGQGDAVCTRARWSATGTSRSARCDRSTSATAPRWPRSASTTTSASPRG